MNNALWSPRGARAGERNRVTGYTATVHVIVIFDRIRVKKLITSRMNFI